jgi:anti-anti-sigma regulatory factor
MSELTITTSQIQGAVPVTILHVSGHLHGDTEAALMDYARRTREDGSQYLVLDLSGVEVLTGVGLRAIQSIFNLFTPQSDVEIIHQHGAEPYKSPYFKLVCPNPDIYFVLNVAGFLQNLLIYNNMEEALNSFTG